MPGYAYQHSGWLITKLVMVGLLIAFHASCAFVIRDFRNGRNRRTTFTRLLHKPAALDVKRRDCTNSETTFYLSCALASHLARCASSKDTAILLSRLNLTRSELKPHAVLSRKDCM
jgi:hypothetical protein